MRTSGALQEYVLLLAQAPSGGLRDKPGKSADAYHTCYNLSGLSTSQHRMVQPAARLQALRGGFINPFESVEIVELDTAGNRVGPEMVLGAGEGESEAGVRMGEIYARAMGWEQEGEMLLVGGEDNEVVRPTLFLRSKRH